MKHDREVPQFFVSAASPCPYLPGRLERKVFTRLTGHKARELNDMLTQWGFRRSQSIAYRPACEQCRACVSVRVMTDSFKLTGSFRRVMARNKDIARDINSAAPTFEQYDLFRDYLNSRHSEGGMADMSLVDYAMMVEDSNVDTHIVEYRGPSPDNGITAGPLVGVALTDLLTDGLSMVYSFFDPALSKRSLGTYMILDHILRAQELNLPYLYLGYWVTESRKMAYKTRFQPQQHLGPDGWLRG